MTRIVIGLVLAMTLFVATSSVEAASIEGKWRGAKGGAIVCSTTECKSAEGNAAGFVILKDISEKDGKGTANMQVKKDNWAKMNIEIGEKELTLVGPRGGKIVWKRAE